MLYDTIINKQQSGKNMEGSDHGLFMVPFQHFPTRTEDNPVTGLRFEHGTP